jgi:ketosteroid isomerase-like protein
MNATELLKEFTSAVEHRDGKRFASLFTEDGVYHDVFYGAFKGREKIAEMIDDWFHRTARDFRWEMFRPVSDGTMLYAYYTFSYVSTLPEAAQGHGGGKRVGFDGVSIMRLHDGKIAEYREVANSAIGLLDIGFAPERVAKILNKEAVHIKARPEWQRHQD